MELFPTSMHGLQARDAGSSCRLGCGAVPGQGPLPAGVLSWPRRKWVPSFGQRWLMWMINSQCHNRQQGLHAPLGVKNVLWMNRSSNQAGYCVKSGQQPWARYHDYKHLPYPPTTTLVMLITASISQKLKKCFFAGNIIFLYDDFIMWFHWLPLELTLQLIFIRYSANFLIYSIFISWCWSWSMPEHGYVICCKYNNGMVCCSMDMVY